MTAKTKRPSEDTSDDDSVTPPVEATTAGAAASASKPATVEVVPRPTWLMQVAYDGAGYHGWQIQLGDSTVQSRLQEAMEQLFLHRGRRPKYDESAKPTLPIWGCSRTDAGVHALAQMVSFDPPAIPTIPPDAAMRALASILPRDIRVLSITEKEVGYRSRYEACGKAYTYVLHRGNLMSPFLHRYCLPLRDPLDLEAMRQATEHLVGEHDFFQFTVNGASTDPDDTVRTLDRFLIREYGNLVLITVVGERFMYRMVRRLVGLLLSVGTGRIAADAVPALIVSQERNLGFDTAAPQGLFLEAVFFDQETMDAYVPGPPPFLMLMGL